LKRLVAKIIFGGIMKNSYSMKIGTLKKLFHAEDAKEKEKNAQMPMVYPQGTGVTVVTTAVNIHIAKTSIQP
jgi:hypothetical protein